MSAAKPPDLTLSDLLAIFPGATVTRLVLKLDSQRNREIAKRAIDRAPAEFVADIHEEKRSDAQNRALWPRLTEIHRQRPTLRGAPMTPDLWKCVFLQHVGAGIQFLPALDERQGVFPVHSSSALSKSKFAELLEAIDAYCAEQGIQLKHFDDGQGAGSAEQASPRAA